MNRAIFWCVLACWLSGQVLASPTTVWECTTRKDFSGGKLTGLILTSEGTLRIGQELREIPSKAVSLWSSAVGPDGTVYFGSGNSGQVYRLAKGKLAKHYATGALIVTALAIVDKVLYAATLPGGKIFRIGPDGKGITFATLPKSHIWSMVAVGKSLVVGTGPAGVVYKISPEGKASVLFDSQQDNILSLAAGMRGTVFAGSDKEAVVYRIAADGSVRVLHDFPGHEVRALAHYKGQVYVGVNEAKKFDNASFVRSLSDAIGREGDGEAVDRKAVLKGLFNGTVYRVDGQRRIEKLLRIEKDFVTTLAVDRRGVAHVGVGMEGRIYRVESVERHSTTFDVKQGQVLSLALVDGRLGYFGTGNTGSCYQVSDAVATRAHYLSPVHDARFPARWGVARWNRTGKLSIQTRSGHSKTPDNTWSAWSRSVSPGASFKVTSPVGRYLQFRVRWADQSAALHRIAFAYLAQNQRARISEFLVGGKAGGTRKLDQVKHKSDLEISWKAADADGDALEFILSYKRLGARSWRRIEPVKPLTPKSTKAAWKTDKLPDGLYLIKLVASDRISNPEGTEQAAFRISRPVLIDNTKPRVLGLVYTAGRLRGRGEDSHSMITRVEVAVNGGQWRLVGAEDGIFDQDKEAFSVGLGLSRGFHSVAVRIYDAAGNAGIEQLLIDVK